MYLHKFYTHICQLYTYTYINRGNKYNKPDDVITLRAKKQEVQIREGGSEITCSLPVLYHVIFSVAMADEGLLIWVCLIAIACSLCLPNIINHQQSKPVVAEVVLNSLKYACGGMECRLYCFGKATPKAASTKYFHLTKLK